MAEPRSTPDQPNEPLAPVFGGRNGCQCAVSTYAAPAMTTSTIATTLSVTIVVLTPADVFEPASRIAMQRRVTSTAGRLIQPPVATMAELAVTSNGARANASGSVIPTSRRTDWT